MADKATGRILIVDDEAAMRAGLSELLSAEGHEVHSAADVDAAEHLLATREFDVFVTDLVMPGRDGMELLDLVRRVRSAAAVIMITGHSTVATAVEAMRRGAMDYISKPFELNDVRLTVRRGVEAAQQRRAGSAGAPPRLIGESPQMKALLKLVQQVAVVDVPVLIVGETGTGKELLAGEVHRRSRRADKPLMSVNCAALPETLLESELFGHARGAFTGAATAREGLFEAADGGTLFLDEIGDITPAAQARLLRVLQDGEIRRVGENTARTVDVRIIAATNQDLAARMQARQFRDDLYYRLNVVTLSPSPLRERREDIPLLAADFLEQFRREAGLPALSLSRDALVILMRYDWPGNVRELQNVIKRAAVVGSSDEVRPSDLPPHLLDVPLPPADSSLEDVEKRHIIEVLRSTRGNISQSARLLEISRPTLRAKIERYGIELGQFR